MEEEYQVVDPQTWELCSTIHAILERDKADGKNDVRAEFLQSQMEAVTRICDTIHELGVEVRRIRQEAHKLAQSLGLALAAAGTHPLAAWTDQKVTEGERYKVLAEELQEVGQRLVTFGMHVHVGIADTDMRIRVLHRMRPYLPLLLALSSSSPFFDGRFTGLRSYRPTVLGALPRSGIPPRFESWVDYRETIETLGTAGLLADPSFIWWDARPSSRFPTLEVRVFDMPTRVEETVCLAAWVQALAAKLAREPETPSLRRFVVELNKWQAARYGLDARLMLLMGRTAQTVREWVEELEDWLSDVATEMGSRAAMAYVHTILQEGTSADRQLRVWQETNDLRAVVAVLSQETMPS